MTDLVRALEEAIEKKEREKRIRPVSYLPSARSYKVDSAFDDVKYAMESLLKSLVLLGIEIVFSKYRRR